MEDHKMNNNNLKILLSQAKDAIEHMDDVLAKKILDQLKKSKEIFGEKTEKIKTYLEIVTIPKLSDEEAAQVLREHYLESFDISVPMDNRLIGKLFFVPEIPRDKVRETLKQGLIQNQQQLGGISISQWIQMFEKEFDVKSRALSAPQDFIKKNERAMILSPVEKERLKKVLSVYDKYLVTTLPVTSPMLEEILGEDASISKFSKEQQQLTGETRNIPIQEALEKYPSVGSQIITSQKLELKSDPRPALPTIKNWISDYTYTFGFEAHDAIERGNFLFQSTNGKKLNNEDRQRLSLILKSFDENSPIQVDIENQKVVFSEMPKVSNTQQGDIQLPHKKSIQEGSSTSPSKNPREVEERINRFYQKMNVPEKSPPPSVQPAQKINRNFSPENIEKNKMSFSYHQKMPFEENKIPRKENPSRQQQSPQKIGRNVVDLKNIDSE